MRSFLVRCRAIVASIALLATFTGSARAADQMYYPAYQNVIDVLVNRINAEDVRIDISAWYLTEHAISIALANRFRAGVQVRLIGDRVSVFESDPLTKREFYWLAAQGVPIRLRYYPDWFPEIVHWKALILAGQGQAAFGSANFTPFELAPASPTDYKDETVLVSDDPAIVNALKTKFDRFWNDTAVEPNSRIGSPPFFKNWDEACLLEPACADYTTQYPTRTPMVIVLDRLEPDYPMPSDMVWSQGPEFNNRLVAEINRESTRVDLVAYRLTVASVADALIQKVQSGVPVRFMMDPEQYTSRTWPEYWLTHANVDRLWAAGIPIKKRVHVGLTHMKTLITSAIATNASSNIAEFWQRDHNYFIPAATKPLLHQSLVTRFDEMWNDPAAFGTFTPEPADAAALSTPAYGAGAVAPTAPLVWRRAPFATSYDVYLGTAQHTMVRVANVPAVLTSDPPTTYNWTPPTPLQGGTTYYWRVVSRTFATDVNPALIANSDVWVFTTQLPGGPIPTGWSTQDVGATGLAGGATFTNGTFSVTGAGADIWGAADGFRFVYQTLSGDGRIVARVVSQQPTHPAAKAGVMMRTSLAANAAHVILDATPSAWLEFMTRATTGGQTSYLDGASGAPPEWLRLTRTGGTITSEISANGTTWTTIGSAPLATGTLYVGLVVSSLSTSQRNTSAFDNVAVVGGTAPPPPPPPPPPTLPAPWSTNDIGATGMVGSASHNSGVFTVSGAGADIWGTADAFRFVYQPLEGDGTIVARVVSVQNTSPRAKAGIMIRQTLAAGSPHVILDATPSAWIEFMTRAVAAGQTSYLGGSGLAAPVWLRLTRTGTAVASAVSGNGVTWTAVGSTTLPAGPLYVGMIVSSVNPAQLNTSTFDNVTVTTDGGQPPPPPPTEDDIVIHAADIPASGRHGAWAGVADPTSPAGQKLATPDHGYAQTGSPLPSPVHYVDVTFAAPAGVPYTLWLRLQALGNAKLNDAVWVQFSDALAHGSPVFPLTSTSGLLVNLATDGSGSSLQGWGWSNGAYWLAQPMTFTFASSGTHTLRIQVREDGVALDQIVLSAGPYLSAPPGGPTNDATIVPKP